VYVVLDALVDIRDGGLAKDARRAQMHVGSPAGLNRFVCFLKQI